MAGPTPETVAVGDQFGSQPSNHGDDNVGAAETEKAASEIVTHTALSVNRQDLDATRRETEAQGPDVTLRGLAEIFQHSQERLARMLSDQLQSLASPETGQFARSGSSSSHSSSSSSSGDSDNRDSGPCTEGND
jgi:hypothetical protein